MKTSLNSVAIAFLLAVTVLGSVYMLRTPAAPAPTPDTKPASHLEAVDAFFTDPAERAIRLALYEQFADCLLVEVDNVPKTTADLGELLKRIQIYRTGENDPERYKEIQGVVGRAIKGRLGCEEKPQELTAARKEAAVEFFRELAEVLR